MIYIYFGERGFEKQVRYTFDTMFHMLDIPHEFVMDKKGISAAAKDILIWYAEGTNSLQELQAANIIFIKKADELFGADYLKPASLPSRIKRYALPSPLCGRNDIISLYHNGDEPYVKAVAEEDKKGILTDMDLISDVFFMLTRYEEVIKVQCHGDEPYHRFPVAETVAFQNGFMDRPVVNEAVELLWSWIDGFRLGYERKNRWEGRSFAALLSHDVDHIVCNGSNLLKRGLLLAKRLLLGKAKLDKAKEYPFGYFNSVWSHKYDPYWTFDDIIGKERSFGFSSTFNFMCSGETSFDDGYRVKSKKVRDLIRQLEVGGFEVGYHGSFNSYQDLQLMRREKQTLDKLVKDRTHGCRQHYLRFQVPDTWRIQEECGLLYDTTLGFAEQEGFRCGTCMPYKPYDIVHDRIMNIWEIPLVAMDTTFYSYRVLDGEKTLEEISNLMDTVSRYGGVFALLVHNSTFYACEYLDWQALYSTILETVFDRNGMGVSGGEIIRQWETGQSGF